MFSRFQSVQKAGFTGDAYKPGLAGMERLSALLGHPWKKYPCIHVAGTNGKGSVCSMLAAALSAGGGVFATGHPRRAKGPATSHKGSLVRALPGRLSPNPAPGSSTTGKAMVGLYTSPHLLDFRERMKIVSGGGFEMITREEVWEFLNLYETHFDGLSFFEITTGMAFWWFERRGVDAAVIEVGLGGRLDSTNIITPVLSVITSIGLDHCALLGSTRPEIAFEKAGIFKPGVPAVAGIKDAETAPAFEKVAAETGTPLVFASDTPAFAGEDGLLARMDLTGPCQNINLHTVLVAIEIMETSEGLRQIRPDWSENGIECTRYVLDAIAEAGKRTGLWGRWQRICSGPETICDIGHNPPALKENFARLEKIREEGRSIIIVYGIMADKDLDGIAPMMPSGARYILAAPGNQRAMDAGELQLRLHRLRPDLHCEKAESVSAAVHRAFNLAQDLPKPLIYIGGSTFVVAEAIPLFNKTTEA